MIITHKINMDLTRRMLQPPVQVMQDDKYSRDLEITLTANGIPWEIPGDFAAMIRWHKESDRTGGDYDSLPNGTLAYSAAGNVLTVKLLPQICVNPGQVTLTVMLAGGNAVAYTFCIVINVCQNPGMQESVPAPEPDVYQNILGNYSMMAARVNNLASLKEGSTTGDAELIDGRVDYSGQVHENLGAHVRSIGSLVGGLSGVQQIAVTRHGELAGEPVSLYATRLQVAGTAKYLEKVRLPVQTDEASIDISVCLYNSEDMTTPLSRVVVIPDTTDVHYVELPVGRWFAPGEQIVIRVQTVAGEWSLLQPRAQEDFSADWLISDLGTSSFSQDEDTWKYAFDNNEIQFVGELVFYDTLREEVHQLQENVKELQDSTATETDAKYFDIDEAGLLSLKPEYRGACTSASYPYGISDNGKGSVGSKNNELPENIVIPKAVDDIAVAALAPGMFRSNHRVKRVAFPSGLTDIPAAIFTEAFNLVEVSGTENVKTIASGAFYKTSVRKVVFPSLETFVNDNQFAMCPYLETVDLGGKVTNLPRKIFMQCVSLAEVNGVENVTSLGVEAFISTQSLKNLSCVKKLSAIEDRAFLLSRLNYDWWSDATDHGCNTLSTPEQLNASVHWAGRTFTPHVTTMLSTFDQHDPTWAKNYIGASTVTYELGCGTVCAAMIYSALKNQPISSPEDFVSEAEASSPGILSGLAEITTIKLGEMLQATGLSVTRKDRYNAANLQEMYNALAEGALVLTCIVGENGVMAGHAIVLHGINTDGEILCVDPAGKRRHLSVYEAMRYAMPIQNMAQFADDGEASQGDFLIVRKN